MSEEYDDIEKLLSHEMLGSFEYQSFRKRPDMVLAPKLANVQVVPEALPVEREVSSTITSTEPARSEVRQLRLVVSKSDAAIATPKPSEPKVVEASGAVEMVFQRLTRTAGSRIAPAVALDLHLRDRPMLPSRLHERFNLSELSLQDAFARLLGRSAYVDALIA